MEEKLIEFVRNNKILYDKAHGGYKNITSKEKKWKEIASQVNLPVEKVKKRWKTIRDRYYRILKDDKCASASRSGQKLSTSEKYKYFEQLCFLTECEHFKSRSVLVGNFTNSAIDEQTTLPNQSSTCFVYEDDEPSDDTVDPLKVAKYSILTESDTENIYTTSPCYFETSKEIDDEQISDEFKEPIRNEVKKKNLRLNNNEKKEGLSNLPQELPNPKEDLEIIGKFIALQLKDLNTDQLTIVHKIISDAIFCAKTGRLTVNSSITKEKQLITSKRKLNAMEEKLIEFVRNNKILYDKAHGGYKNIISKEKKWEEIASQVNLPVEKVKKRWKTIRDRYYRILKDKCGSASGSSQKVTASEKYKYFDQLCFLNECEHFNSSTVESFISNINSAIDEQTTSLNQSSTCFTHEDHESSDDNVDPLKAAKYSILTESDTENMYTTSSCYYETSKEIDDTQISDEFKEPIKNEFEKKNSRLNNNKIKDLSNSSQEIPNPKEDLEIIGKFIALQLKDLNTDQLTIVHKIISDAIFYAKTGRLTVNSSINLDT